MMVNVTTDRPKEEFNPSTVALVCLVRAFCLNYSSTEDDDDEDGDNVVVGIMHYYNVDRKGRRGSKMRGEELVVLPRSPVVCSRDLNTNLKEESANKTWPA